MDELLCCCTRYAVPYVLSLSLNLFTFIDPVLNVDLTQDFAQHSGSKSGAIAFICIVCILFAIGVIYHCRLLFLLDERQEQKTHHRSQELEAEQEDIVDVEEGEKGEEAGGTGVKRTPLWQRYLACYTCAFLVVFSVSVHWRKT